MISAAFLAEVKGVFSATCERTVELERVLWLRKISSCAIPIGKKGIRELALSLFKHSFVFLADKRARKTERVISDGLKAGNFSIIDQMFNGTGASNGTIGKIKEALKNGNLSALLAGGGSGGMNGSAIIDKIKVSNNC